MVYTGPQKYPGANYTSYWYQDTYGGTQFEANVVVWHTTEGRSVPTYADSSGRHGASAPNLTALPDFANKKLKWYQHFDIDRSSRAMVNLSGGVETNTLNALQIEKIGTCDPATRDRWKAAGYQFIYWPDAPDWALAELGHMVEWLYVNHKIKKQSTVTWKPYPSSYGATSTRLTGTEWSNYYGHLGHQHVPENTHGDPGDFDFARVIQFANGATQEVNVALTTADVEKLVTTDGVVKSPDYKLSSVTNKFWTLETYHYETYRKARSAASDANSAKAGVASLKVDLDALAAKVDSIALGGVDLDALAAKVADELHRRMAS